MPIGAVVGDAATDDERGVDCGGRTSTAAAEAGRGGGTGGRPAWLLRALSGTAAAICALTIASLVERCPSAAMAAAVVDAAMRSAIDRIGTATVGSRSVADPFQLASSEVVRLLPVLRRRSRSAFFGLTFR
jgi:hypothetical protein